MPSNVLKGHFQVIDFLFIQIFNGEIKGPSFQVGCAFPVKIHVFFKSGDGRSNTAVNIFFEGEFGEDQNVVEEVLDKGMELKPPLKCPRILVNY